MGKILIAYFSWSGNAGAIAHQIAQETGGDLFEIKTVGAYPETYDECDKAAKQEKDANARPSLTETVANMEQYGTVFLCYPNWWGTLPMAVFTFLESYDFATKTIYPLITHGGSDFEHSLDDMKKLCPAAVIGKGLSVSAFSKSPSEKPNVAIPDASVSSWLREIGIRLS